MDSHSWRGMTAGADDHRQGEEPPSGLEQTTSPGAYLLSWLFPGPAADDVPETLWIDMYARRSGVAALLDHLGVEKSDTYAPYAFIVLLWAVLSFGFPAIRFVETGAFPVAQTPGILMILPSWLFVVGLIRWLHAEHELVLEREHFPGEDKTFSPPNRQRSRWRSVTRSFLTLVGVRIDGDQTDLTRTVPRRVKRVLLVPGLGLHAAWFFVDPSPMSWLGEVWGPELAALFFFVIVPGVFFVFGVELVSIYIGIHVLLPLSITVSDRINFDDPHLYGGLRPVGALLRNSAASFLVVLSAYVAFETVARGSTPLDAFSQVILFGGIAFGALIFAAPVYWLHRYMRRQKWAKVEQIVAEVRDQNEGGVTFPDIDPTNRETFEFNTQEYIRLDRVERMKEFPVDFSLVLEFLIVLALPYVSSITWEAIRYRFLY